VSDANPNTPSPAAEDDDKRSQSPVRNEWMRQVHQIRKQEFAYLRSVQKREASGDGEPTLAGFQTKSPSLGSVREDTLKKIDEIEARLNLMWVSSQPTPQTSPPKAAFDPAPDTDRLKQGPPTTMQMGAPSVFTQVMYDAAMPSSVLMVDTVDTPPAPIIPMQVVPDPVTPVKKELPTAPMQSVPIHADGVLATVGALFALGETDLAAQHLLRAVRSSGDRKVQARRWLLALLEIYRATGNQAQFDWTVLEYFDYWDGITPQWLSASAAGETALRSGPKVPTQSFDFEASGLDHAVVWRCPSTLDRGAARELRSHWSSARHCALDWTSLSTIDADAAADLSTFFNTSEEGPSQLVFFDTPNLLYVLEQATPQGQAQVARSLWNLRFCFLGLMHMKAAFDAATADFSLTFIENAPVWRPGKARFDGDALASPAIAADNVASDSPWRLHGQVLGASGIELPEHPLEHQHKTINIACGTLVRMDDAATAKLLRWVRRAVAQKTEVHFSGVSLLVAAVWAASGLHDHAQIHLREPH
jgi:ABC-type transporter Mla MlaB component